jgi:hypothetical protein
LRWRRVGFFSAGLKRGDTTVKAPNHRVFNLVSKCRRSLTQAAACSGHNDAAGV